ncbi:unnamed protein product, partial [Ectocarpus sp. 6 AP-2014]
MGGSIAVVHDSSTRNFNMRLAISPTSRRSSSHNTTPHIKRIPGTRCENIYGHVLRLLYGVKLPREPNTDVGCKKRCLYYVPIAVPRTLLHPQNGHLSACPSRS